MQHLGVLVEEFSFFPHQETEVGALFRELWVCRSRWLEGGRSIPLPTAGARRWRNIRHWVNNLKSAAHWHRTICQALTAEDPHGLVHPSSHRRASERPDPGGLFPFLRVRERQERDVASDVSGFERDFG